MNPLPSEISGKEIVTVKQQGTDPAALETAREFHRQTAPLQTILFGSRARGDHRPDSDVDLLVLNDAEPDSQYQEMAEETARAILKHLIPAANGIDVVHMTMDQYRSKYRLRNNLANSAHRWGVPVLPPENLDYSNEYEEEEVDWNDVQDRVRSGLGFALGLGKMEVDQGQWWWDKIMGHTAQQALENSYKALLGANGFDYPTSGRDGHHLKVIAQQIRRDLDLPGEERLPGEDHLYLTEFSGAAVYLNEHAPLEQEKVLREVPDAVMEIMDLIHRTTGQDANELLDS